MNRQRRLKTLFYENKFKGESLVELKDFIRKFEELNEYWQLNIFVRIMELGESPSEAISWAESDHNDCEVCFELEDAARDYTYFARSFLNNEYIKSEAKYINDFIDYAKMGEQLLKDGIVKRFYDPEDERDYYYIH